MARLRYNGLTATLDATGLTAAATTIGFTAALSSMSGAVPTITGSDYIPLVIDGEIIYLTGYTTGAVSGTITRAQESTTAAVHAAGATIENAPTSRDVRTGARFLARTAGDINSSQTTFTALDTALDLTIPAQAGDILEVVLSVIVGPRQSGATANNLNFTAYTRVGGADVNNIAGGSGAVPGWFGPDALFTISGHQFYTVVAGDIDTSGNVTLRLFYKADVAAYTRTMFANSTNPMQFAVKNIGPY